MRGIPERRKRRSLKNLIGGVVDHLTALQAGPYFAPGSLDGTIDLVEGWYGGTGLPGDFDGDYVPSSWSGQSTLYLDVVSKSCRACHLQQIDSDFTTFTDFNDNSGSIEEHVFREGSMPNALKTYQDFWLSTSPARPDILAAFLGISNVSPGFPRASISVVGNTLVEGNVITLTAETSLFATEYEWSIPSVPSGSAVTTNSLSNLYTSSTSFVPDISSEVNENYEIQLTVFKGNLSDTTTLGLSINPPTYSFVNDIVPIFQSGGESCTSCHTGGTPSGSMNLNSSQVSTHAIYLELTAEASQYNGTIRTNTGSPSSSLILQKATNTISHSPGEIFPADNTPGTPYNKILTWIQEGAVEN